MRYKAILTLIYTILFYCHFIYNMYQFDLKSSYVSIVKCEFYFCDIIFIAIITLRSNKGLIKL